MEQKINQLNKQKSAIANCTVNTNKTAKAKQTKGFLQARRVLLEQYWAKYCTLFDELICIGTEEALAACTQNDYETCEITYAEAMGNLNDQLDNMGSMPSAAELNNSTIQCLSSNPLPRINLPTFDGNYLHWFAFKDMFVSMVTKNATLSNTQRLQYLKDGLKGDAQHALDNIATIESNFSVAWTLLEGKYENMRVIVNAHLSDIMNLPTAQKESAGALRLLTDGVTSGVRALQQLGRKTEHWDDWLVYILVHKMDPVSRKAWEMSLVSTSEIPTYETVKKFLENRMHSLEIVQCYEATPTKDAAASKSKIQAVKGCHITTNYCICCQGQHFLYACDSFRGKSPKERYNTVRTNNLCFNCLHARHQGECPSKRRCKECDKAHHSQLHEWFSAKSDQKLSKLKADVASSSSSFAKPISDTQQICVTSHNSAINNLRGVQIKLPIVMLATTLVKARSDENRSMILRALIDPGAEATFVSETVVQQMRLKRTPVSISVNGASGERLATAKSAVNLVLGAVNSDFEMDCQALVLARVGNLTPSSRVKVEVFNEFKHLQLADPKYYEPAAIDLILSAADYATVLCSGLERSLNNSLVAQETKFGWIVFGGMSSSTSAHQVGLDCFHMQLDLNAALQKFWALEEVDIPERSSLSHDELYCEQYFDNTTRRDDCGRYIVRLPTKPNVDLTKLNLSKQIALSSLRHGLRRLKGNEEMHHHYKTFMSEYESLGHMHRVPGHEPDPIVTCYLPHHGVWKTASTTTKLRVVFNAAKEYGDGLSLNDCLHIGPKLQNDMVAIILNWRRYRIAFTGDIEKMYRQIWVNPEDTDLQRIFWCDSSTNLPVAFRLLTVTYGTNCAPYLALKVLRALAAEYEQEFPGAAWSLNNEFYVDDVLSGGDNAVEAITKWQNLQSLLKAGGFPLRKFNSNCSEVVQIVDAADREYSDAIELNWEGETKALGIVWLPKTDELSYKFNNNNSSNPITKRQLASDLAKLFDPLGLIAPSIICGKIMLQELWKTGLNWDDDLPDELQAAWLRLRDELSQLNGIKIARWIAITTSQQQKFDVHIFADASQKAYAAVAYLRVEDAERVTTTLLMAKTKVAPIRKSTIPRLELCAALLATRLLQKVKQCLHTDADSTLWSDSRTVLCWLRSGAGPLKQFEANRVTEILQISPFGNWKYVPSGENPADVASRGASATQLIDHKLWWKGPTWLSEATSKWPDQRIIELKSTTKPIQASVTQTETKTWLGELIETYSSIDKLLVVIAWCLRYVSARLRMPHAREKFCTWSERAEALQRIVWHTQHQTFRHEIKCLKEQKPIPKQSRIVRLNPVLDTKGILRLGGRLAHAKIAYDARFPMILPKDGHFTHLLIAQAHSNCLHGGTQATLHYLRQKFWVLDGRNAVKRYVSKCITCFKQKNTMQYQLMGNLPAPRCNPALPFLHSGVDYAGPFNIRTTKGRGHRSYKGYIALFVCFATRAIHLELVSDLTTQTFLDALHRFVACRGLCSDLYSDQGTTFIGADALLKTDLAEFKKQLSAGANECSKLGINWHFIPPAAPNFGGLWEAGVKSAKTHLKRTINTTTLTFEEFYTVLKRIEACLNSRPLARIKDDPNEFAILTPGHFLVGRALINIPEPSILDTKIGLLYRWKMLRQLHQDFWRRWSVDYLHDLQVRTKWHQTQQSISKGQVVLLRDERLPPSHWSMGIIEEVHPGQDGFIRVATVRTAKTTLKRPISKIVVLPIADNVIDASSASL